MTWLLWKKFITTVFFLHSKISLERSDFRELGGNEHQRVSVHIQFEELKGTDKSAVAEMNGLKKDILVVLCVGSLVKEHIWIDCVRVKLNDKAKSFYVFYCDMSNLLNVQEGG